MNLHVSVDRKTETPCLVHKEAACHPCNTGPDPCYVCYHRAWPHVRHGDFPPVVQCEGKPQQCELVKSLWWSRYKGGLTQRRNNLKKKLKSLILEMVNAVGLEAGEPLVREEDVEGAMEGVADILEAVLPKKEGDEG